MNFAKHKVLLVAGIVTILAVGTLGFLAYRKYSAYRKSEQALEGATGAKAVRGKKKEFGELINKTPYPSDANRAVLESNSVAVSQFFSVAVNRVRGSQSFTGTVDQTKLVSVMNGFKSRIAAEARAKIVEVKTNFFMFGLPVDNKFFETPESLSRVLGQAKITEELCHILFSGPITKLSYIQRYPFELLTPDPSGAPRDVKVMPDRPLEKLLLPEAESNQFYRAERFEIVFDAREDAVMRVLNTLATSDRLFSVVRHLEMVNEPAIRNVESKSTDRKASAPEERVVAGREPITVSLVVDVYLFSPPAKPEESR